MAGVELSIGEFSKLAGMTVKALRFYQESGLLEPSRVDVGNGYRYYSPGQVETARAITLLRELGFPVAEICELVRDDCESGDSLVTVLQRRRKELTKAMRDDRSRLQRLDEILAIERLAELTAEITPEKVYETELSPTVIATIRHCGSYADCGKLFGKLARQYGRYLAGKPLLLCLDEDYQAENANFEVGFPVKACDSKQGSRVHELPGGRALCIKHRGPYEQLWRSYRDLIKSARLRGWNYDTPTREIYHKGPGMIFRGNPNNYVTEIQLLESVQ